MSSFEDALYGAYDIPQNVPGEVKSDSPEYYKHPKGTYVGIIGTLQYKFEGPDGKKCDAGTPGAVAVRCILKVLLKRFNGEIDNPQMEQILGDSLDIPQGRKAAELYYPVMLSLKRSDQWKTEKLFSEFRVHDIDDSQIVKDKIVRYKKFPLYLGLSVSLTVEHGEKKGSPYVSQMALLNVPRMEIDKVVETEKEIMVRLQDEINARKNSDDINAPLPERSIDEIFAGQLGQSADIGEYSDGNGNDGLPF